PENKPGPRHSRGPFIFGTNPVAIRWQFRHLFFRGFCKRLISKGRNCGEWFNVPVDKTGDGAAMPRYTRPV
ncbi:MAG TPA: hypothetical protein VMT72_01340, partial [Pseudolabrys sp.]|nr:hypothetical protein [Pseudolabrys sp.]